MEIPTALNEIKIGELLDVSEICKLSVNEAKPKVNAFLEKHSITFNEFKTLCSIARRLELF